MEQQITPTTERVREEPARQAWLWIAASVCCRSGAAICAKQAGLTSIGRGISGILINVWYLAELVALFGQALCWLMVLRRVPLNTAYPFMSLVFALNLASAWVLFGERVEGQHVAGILLVMAGVALVARTAESG